MEKLHIKVNNLTKLVQIIFNVWFSYFEYIGYFWCHITLILLKSWFDQFQWWSIIQWEISNTKLNKSLLIHSIRHKSKSHFYSFKIKKKTIMCWKWYFLLDKTKIWKLEFRQFKKKEHADDSCHNTMKMFE